MKAMMRTAWAALIALVVIGMAAPAMAERGDRERVNPDTDGDGQVSQAEWGAMKHKRGNFEDIDTNSDNQLSQDEIRKAHEGMRDRARGRRNQ